MGKHDTFTKTKLFMWRVLFTPSLQKAETPNKALRAFCREGSYKPRRNSHESDSEKTTTCGISWVFIVPKDPGDISWLIMAYHYSSHITYPKNPGVP